VGSRPSRAFKFAFRQKTLVAQDLEKWSVLRLSLSRRFFRHWAALSRTEHGSMRMFENATRMDSTATPAPAFREVSSSSGSPRFSAPRLRPDPDAWLDHHLGLESIGAFQILGLVRVCDCSPGKHRPPPRRAAISGGGPRRRDDLLPSGRRPGSRRPSRPSISSRRMKRSTAARTAVLGALSVQALWAQPYLACSPSPFCAPTPRSSRVASNDAGRFRLARKHHFDARFHG